MVREFESLLISCCSPVGQKRQMKHFCQQMRLEVELQSELHPMDYMQSDEKRNQSTSNLQL